jgi:K+-sensing histidine kinase KdpD
MSNDTPSAGKSLSELVLAACDGLNDQFNRGQVSAEFDFHDNPIIDLDARQITTAIQMIVEQAIARTPPQHNLLITTTSGVDCWEVEVADGSEGCAGDEANESGSLTVFRLHQTIRPFGGRVEICRCAQGGQAITLVGPLTRRRGNAA